ncbi:cupin domain-containing protein [Bounagaea algeriensis]
MMTEQPGSGAARSARSSSLGEVEVVHPDEAGGSGGVLWRLQESARQLDANVVHLPARERVDWHTEQQRDVLVVVLSGTGTVHTDDGRGALVAGTVLWLPRDTRRSLVAGPDGMSYVTAHQRRPGLQIQRRTLAEPE